MARSRLLAAVGVVGVAVGGIALARQDPGLPPTIPVQSVPVAYPAAPTPAVVPPVAPPRVVAPEAMSIDQLVDQVEAIRRQKAELERREQEALRVLAAKVKAQQERVNKVMGRPADRQLTEVPPIPDVAPSVPAGPIVER